MLQFDTDSSRWQAVQTRNQDAANSFVYCVRSTRIVCRPNCGARLARRANIVFRDSFADARAAGYRPCKRCRPELPVYDPRAKLIARACETIEERNVVVGLSELAATAGLTKSHFHRVFKEVTGVTPRFYAVNSQAKDSTAFSPDGPSVPKSEDARGARQESGEIRKDLTYADLLAMEDCSMGSVEPLQDKADEEMRSVAGDEETIEYTVQTWASGFVIIAVTAAGVCWVEAGNSAMELHRSLRSQFPNTELMASPWPERSTDPGMDSGKHAMFSGVMEALVRPTGKILNFLYDVS